MRKILALALAMLLLAVPALAEESATDEPVVITIFHTNDVHARYNSDDGMGYAMMAAFVNAARNAGENVLVMDAGDTLHGTVFANAVQGESIVEIMNAVDYDVMTPGNHDYNYGYDRLKELEAEMDFPLVSANMKLTDGKDAFTPYTILEIADKKIGVVGASNPEMKSAIHPDHIAALDFGDVSYVEEAVKAVQEEGVDAIVILAHWGCNDAYDPNSIEALASIPGVSLVIDGHSHTELYDIQQADGGALVTSTGEYLHNLGKVVLTFNPDQSLEVEAELIPDPGLYEDHGIINAIEDVEEGQSEVLDEVIGETSVRLEGEREIVRTSESNWGNLATNIFMEMTGADVALMNGGNIRQTIEAGPITVRDINTVFPFANIVVTQKITGQALLDALENGISLYPETSGGFPQIAGMTLTFDPEKPAGERITELLIGDTPVDPDAEYVLATNDFLAAGGDNYESLAAFPVEMYMGTMDEMVVEYLKENSPVAPELEGRIRHAGDVVEEPVAEETEAVEEEAPAADVTAAAEEAAAEEDATEDDAAEPEVTEKAS